MAQVYGQAEVVLCSVSTNNANQSFLGNPITSNRRAVSPFVVSIDGYSEKATKIRLRCYPVSNGSDPWDSEPLDTRGWTFQERYLGTRCVRYDRYQITWECATDTVGEIFPQWAVVEGSQLRRDNALKVTDWRQVISEYSGRSFTHSSDRLPAISGMAERFSRQLHCRYLAGLWQESLLLNLGWFAPVSTGLRWKESVDTTYSVAGAPSWSWASYSRKALYEFAQDEPEPDAKAKIVDVHCNPSTQNPLGTVDTDSDLSIQGPCLDLELELFVIYREGSDSESRVTIDSENIAPGQRAMTDTNDRDWRLTCSKTPAISELNYLIFTDDPLEIQHVHISPPDTAETPDIAGTISSWQRVRSNRAEGLVEGTKAQVKLLFTLYDTNRWLHGLLLTPDPDMPSKFRRIGIAKCLFKYGGIDVATCLALCTTETVTIR